MAKKAKLSPNAKALAALRVKAILRNWPGRGDAPQLPGRMEGFYGGIERRSTRSGHSSFLRRAGKLKAGLLVVEEDHPQLGLKRMFLPDYEVTDRAALSWSKKQLLSWAPGFKTGDSVFLPAAYRGLLPLLLKQGFHIESVMLEGDPARALRAAKKFPDVDLGRLKVRKVAARDIPAIQLIHKVEFGRNPHFGSFCASPGFLRNLKKEILLELRQETHSHYVFTRKGKVLGYFATSAHGPHAGITFAFSRAIQGRGLVKHAYLILLTDMVAKGAKLFRGGTAQPAVLRLGKKMGRKLTVYMLEYGPGHFPAEHFRYP